VATAAADHVALATDADLLVVCVTVCNFVSL